jgi:hypothetical protein
LKKSGAGNGDCDSVDAAFNWGGNDEADEASGDGWAEIQPMATAPAKSPSYRMQSGGEQGIRHVV